jgi:hypothetical protein
MAYMSCLRGTILELHNVPMFFCTVHGRSSYEAQESKPAGGTPSPSRKKENIVFQTHIYNHIFWDSHKAYKFR